MAQPIKVVYGAAAMGNRDPVNLDDDIAETFAVLKKYGVTTLDSAQLYGNSEKRIGEVKGGDKFIVDTKWLGGWTAGSATEENILTSARESVKKLGTKPDIFYIHAPDAKTPISSTLAGVNAAYKEGLFHRFGLSNFSADDVKKVYDHCKEQNYILPTVYQGNYSPVARKQETVLFPTLRELNIAFYAYSPLAGGFLTKTKQQIEEGAGRFNTAALGGMYHEMYTKPSYIDALAKWEKLANDVGCSRADLAYRWVAYNSPLKPQYGDAIIVGASSIKQLDQTLSGLKDGPLPDSAVKAIDDIWEEIKHDAPLDNFSR